MKIQFRTSGGRGEYEVAGTHGQYAARDLVNHDIQIHLGPWGVVKTGVYVREDSGKVRLRLRAPSTPHITRQISAALLMPRMTRSAETGGAGVRVMLDEQYSFRALDCSAVAVTAPTGAAPGVVTMSFSSMSFNNDVAEDSLSVPQRTARIDQVHAAAQRYPDPLRTLLVQHRALVRGPGPYPAAMESLVQEIMISVADQATYFGVSYVMGSDPLPALELMQSLPLTPPPPVDLGQIQAPEVRRRELQERRLAVARTASAFAFGRRTREAYGHTCVFCGLHLPQGNLRRGGVDGMHILSYADFDLDYVSNGLCGCKLDHWAFDEGLIMLRYDATSCAYFVHVTELGAAELGSAELTRFRALEGPVSECRLPADPADRPAPDYLTVFNKLMGNTPA